MNSSSIETRQLTLFAVIMAGAALVLAWIFGGWLLFAVSGMFLAAGLVAPRLLAPLYRYWMRLGEVLGWVNTRLILILIFYLVVTPIGLLLRLFRRSPLAAEERNGSFWAEPPEHSWGDKHFEKQF